MNNEPSLLTPAEKRALYASAVDSMAKDKAAVARLASRMGTSPRRARQWLSSTAVLLRSCSDEEAASVQRRMQFLVAVGHTRPGHTLPSHTYRQH